MFKSFALEIIGGDTVQFEQESAIPKVFHVREVRHFGGMVELELNSGALLLCPRDCQVWVMRKARPSVSMHSTANAKDLMSLAACVAHGLDDDEWESLVDSDVGGDAERCDAIAEACAAWMTRQMDALGVRSVEEVWVEMAAREELDGLKLSGTPLYDAADGVQAALLAQPEIAERLTGESAAWRALDGLKVRPPAT